MHRIALGYDSHRFAPGRALILGGVQVACEQGLTGHSDADAVLHAVTDAILGAIAAGDIGELFEDTDPKWAGADSAVFVRHAAALAAERGYAIGNCDVTILAERPKLAPYKRAIRDRIAELLGIEPEAVSVKAKTNEGMGFVGRGEGIAAIAVVMMSDR